MTSITKKLEDLKIVLPEAPAPVGSYVAAKKVNGFIYISGQLPIDTDGKMIKGRVGKDLDLEQDQKASRLCVINILYKLKKAVNWDLDKVKNCIKITGYVNSSDDFKEQPKVINPASETLAAAFENLSLIHIWRCRRRG